MLSASNPAEIPSVDRVLEKDPFIKGIFQSAASRKR